MCIQLYRVGLRAVCGCVGVGGGGGGGGGVRSIQLNMVHMYEVGENGPVL